MKANKIIFCTRCFDNYMEYDKVIFVNSEAEMAHQISNRYKDKLPLNFYNEYLNLHSSENYVSEVLNLLKKR